MKFWKRRRSPDSPPSSKRPEEPLTRAALTWLLAALALVAWSPAHAEDTDALVPESPYFHVKSDDPTLDALPLKATKVDVRIAGVIAEVTVTQQYRNEGQRPIEARYVFPGSTRAAVHAMNVRLGERLISAEIREKQRARLEYDAAKREGKTGIILGWQNSSGIEDRLDPLPLLLAAQPTRPEHDEPGVEIDRTGEYEESVALIVTTTWSCS